MCSARSRWRLALCVAAFLALVTLAGCASGDTETQKAAEKEKLLPGQVSLDETVYECLVEVGVQVAVARRDLAFFRDARAARDVVQIGEEEDHQDDVVVRLLASRGGGAREWMLWYSQPASTSLNPEEILRLPLGPTDTGFSPAENPYVAFKVKPKESFRKEIHRCVEYPLDAG